MIQETSQYANRKADSTGLKQRRREKILNALISMREGGTFDDIAKATGLEYHAVGRRCKELRDANKVMEAPSKGLSPTGNPAKKWQVVPQQLTLLH